MVIGVTESASHCTHRLLAQIPLITAACSLAPAGRTLQLFEYGSKRTLADTSLATAESYAASGKQIIRCFSIGNGFQIDLGNFMA